MNIISQHIIATAHGPIVVEDRAGAGIPLVLIHGNSSCLGVFRRQIEGDAVRDRRVIAFDLPGHGRSCDAPDPDRSYNRSGLADATLAVLGRLGVTEAVVLGWSLGGHIGVELLTRFPGLRGLMIVGTPPAPRGGMAQGFITAPHRTLAGQEQLSALEATAFVETIFGASAEPFLIEAALRTDRRFRKRLFEAARAGDGIDQRQAVETSRIPLAVVNGAADRLINLDYVDTPAYANLWMRSCLRLAGLGHAPFWEAPEMFNPILDRFLADVAPVATYRASIVEPRARRRG
ncbi:alpha/beta hydrolase [soil metagenome]